MDVVIEGGDDNDEENADREGGKGGGKNGRVNLSGECEGFNAAQLEALVQDFGNVFGENNMGSTDVVTLSINTQDAEPVSQPLYSVPLNLREPVRAEIQDLEDAGIIVRSDSPWVSPLVPVCNKNGKVRLCVDYHQLNQVTVPEPYYMQGL